ISRFGHAPDANTNEDLRIQTHLSYVENLLRQKDVSNLPPAVREKRAHLLDLLHDYWQAGKFPRNFDYTDRRPCFIDKNNTICAVGYLVEKTAGLEVAEDINKSHQYDDIFDMNDAVVNNWINESGFSKTEIAMIQPDYGCWGCTYCSGNKVWVCRWSNCQYECKCVSPNNVDNWQNNGHPCDTIQNHGNGNGGGNNFSIGQPGTGSFAYESSLEIYPNPAEALTTISFNLDQPENVSVVIYDLNGKVIEKIMQGFAEKGQYDLDWNTENISPGVYLVRVDHGGEIQMGKISIIN
ncbi:MAG TPA: T9SS type A sorting domain-containing protein, partial [Saprospiraceae bacterium]|nr:T9SS type A sorting domain-containing protein [Saprospiraceae bacterium]